MTEGQKLRLELALASLLSVLRELLEPQPSSGYTLVCYPKDEEACRRIVESKEPV